MLIRIQRLVIMSLFSFLSCKSNNKNSPPKTLLVDDFIDNSRGWVDVSNRNSVLIQKIIDGQLCLDSSTDEMGVASSIDTDLNALRNFTIEASLKIKSKGDLGYASIDFGILKLEQGTRNINGVETTTDLGDIKNYFGYSDKQEVIIAGWKKGVETYYYRGYSSAVHVDTFNKLSIHKEHDSISYTINDTVLFTQKAKKIKGSGLGFSVAPNATLWVDYIKVIN